MVAQPQADEATLHNRFEAEIWRSDQECQNASRDLNDSCDKEAPGRYRTRKHQRQVNAGSDRSEQDSHLCGVRKACSCSCSLVLQHCPALTLAAASHTNRGGSSHTSAQLGSKIPYGRTVRLQVPRALVLYCAGTGCRFICIEPAIELSAVQAPMAARSERTTRLMMLSSTSITWACLQMRYMS